MLVSASTDSKQLAKSLGIVKDRTDAFRSSMLHLNQLTQVFQNFANGVSQMSSIMQTFVSANSAQIEAETKLANNMRNTMDAREEDIQSIKDLCAAQQELGVIGDEVQLAGAQELATYLEEKASLEKLIPVMNDMLAQQYGLNASQESAAQIATMLGKVMEGQTGALSRYGYKFNEAQEYILKYGEESEKAATLAEVVSESVGGMNAALAQTDAGKAKQIANALGDWNEKIGSILAPYEKLILYTGQFSLALNALTSIAGGAKGAFILLSTGISKTLVAMSNTAPVFNMMILEEKMLIRWSAATGISLKALQVILRGFLGLGIVAAVWAIVEVFQHLTNTSKKTVEEFDSVKEAQEEFTRSAAKAKLDIDNETRSLKSLMDAKKDTSKAVDHLNSKYGESFGVYKTAAEWYDTLINKSKLYIRQKGFEAQALTLSAKLAEAEVKLEENYQKRRDLWKNSGAQKTIKTDAWVDQDGRVHEATTATVDTSEYSSLKEEARPLVKEITALKSQLDTALGKIEEYGKALSSTAGETKKLTADTMTLGQVKARLDALDKEALTATTKAEFARIRAERKELEARKKSLEKSMGIGSKTSSNEPKYYNNPTNEAQYRKNINYYAGKLTGEDNAEQRKILQNIALWQREIDMIELRKKKMQVPADLKTVEDVAKKLDYLTAKRKLDSAEDVKATDREIEAMKKLQKGFEMAARVDIDDNKIETYDEITKKQEYYNYLVNEGTAAQIRQGKEGLAALDKIKQKLDEKYEFSIEPDLTNLRNINDYDAAIRFYTDRQQKEDGDQIQKTQDIIDRLTKGKKALQLGIELPNMQKEVGEIEGLKGREYRIKVQGIGFEQLTEKIRDLSKELDNPNLTDTQRKQLEDLRASYEEMRRDSVMTFSTLTDGWGNIRDIGNTIENVTSALV